MNIILFGPPGAGKGTQAENIVKSFNLYKVSSGDLLRNEVSKKTNLGNEIKSTIEKGALVSDKIINNLIIKIFGLWGRENTWFYTFRDRYSGHNFKPIRTE